MDRTRAARAVFAAGASAYALSVAVASQRPGPRAWALHLPGFLPLPTRLLVMALLLGGALCLVIDALRAKASLDERAATPAEAPRHREPGSAGNGGARRR